MTPPSLDCVRSVRAMRQADLRDLAAAVLWLGVHDKLERAEAVLSLYEVQLHLSDRVPQARPRLLRTPPETQEVQYLLHEAVQVLEHNRLVLWRFSGELQYIVLTRRGREALRSENLTAYITL